MGPGESPVMLCDMILIHNHRRWDKRTSWRDELALTKFMDKYYREENLRSEVPMKETITGLGAEWFHAIMTEIKSFIKNDTWMPMDLRNWEKMSDIVWFYWKTWNKMVQSKECEIVSSGIYRTKWSAFLWSLRVTWRNNSLSKWKPRWRSPHWNI